MLFLNILVEFSRQNNHLSHAKKLRERCNRIENIIRYNWTIFPIYVHPSGNEKVGNSAEVKKCCFDDSYMASVTKSSWPYGNNEEWHGIMVSFLL